jgi:EmrB/QacA subfamily drug resistance transporter
MTAAAGTVQLDPRRWRALALVGTAFFMTILDVSIVNVALPSIAEDLQFSRENLQWVVTAYAITFGGFLLLGGRAADLLGRRRVFMVGVGIFTIASLFCGLATSEAWLIAARAVQGLGAAIISPAALSIVQTSFPEGPERNKALGIWGALGGSGAAAGVLFGGILTEYLGWEWIFFVNVPVGVLVLALTVATIRESRVDDARRTYDPLGAVTITASLMVLVFALSKAPDIGWATFRTIGLIVLSAALLAAFLVTEIRHRAPLVPLSFFRIRTVAAANGVAALLGASLFANFFVLTLYAQQVLGFSALKTGLTFLATAGTVVVVAGLAQALVTRVGPKPVMMTGFALFGGGLLYYTQISVGGSFVSDLLPGYLLVGFGLPFAFISVTIAALAGVSAAQAGLASGLLNTSQQIGGAIGVAVSSTIFTSKISDLLARGEPQPVALTEGFQAAFWVLAGIAALGLVTTAIFLRREDTIPELEEGARAPVL